MSNPSQPVENPTEAMERMRAAMRQILAVSKPEIVRREREAKEQRKQERDVEAT